MSLEEDFKRFSQKAIDRFVRIKKRAAFGLFSSVVLQTPVLKGVLRNNWFIEFDSIALKTTEEPDASGSGVIQRTETMLAGTTPLNSIYFVNNLPYVKPIEYDGLSAKAPDGMVRVNAARWQQFVDDATRMENERF